MSCAKSGCHGDVDFDINGGLCINHYVDWCLVQDEVPPDQYEVRYAEALREVKDHMRVMDTLEDVRDLFKDGILTTMFDGDPFVGLLASALKSYDALYTTDLKGKSNGMLS